MRCAGVNGTDGRGHKCKDDTYCCFCSEGYSKVLQEDQLNVEILAGTIREVFSERMFWRERLSKFGSTDALDLIISEIERAFADVD